VLQGRRIALDLYGIAAAIRALPVAVAVKCHSPHMFSRRGPKQSYRNLIKTRLYACACGPTRGFSVASDPIMILRVSPPFIEMHAYEIPISPTCIPSRF
jgi:hypothetical protein